MAISASQVKELRAKTGLGMMKCKEALEACNGDFDKAIEYLRKQGLDAATKKSSRTASEGVIGSYVHSNHKIGVLVEVNCESDFVARSEEFQSLVKDLCLQVAAASPIAVDRDGLPKDLVERERDIFRAQMKDKPEQILEKIIDGKMKKFYQEGCLLEQIFVKDESRKQQVEDLLKAAIAKLGENIVIRRFQRFQVGEEA